MPLGLKTIFTVSGADLERLGARDAVEFFGELLWAEARRIGLPVTQVSVPRWTDVPDGGIDAKIDLTEEAVKSDFLKAGHTAFQIKAGASFHPWKKAHIKRELFGPRKSATKQNLGESVRKCFDSKGRYILVSTRIELTEPQRRLTIKSIKESFATCGYKNAKVEVWGQNQILGLLHRFPSLKLQLNDRGHVHFRVHKVWSRQEDMTPALKGGAQQDAFISQLRKELRRTDAAVHVRVYGEPGLGKTKLVLEATRAEDLEPLVLYCKSPTQLRDGGLLNEVLKEDNTFSCTIVIDECDEDSRIRIWNLLKNIGPRVKIVTIYNEPEKSSGTTVYLDCPPLGDEQIIEILEGYGVPKNDGRRWAELCGGSPRVAHVIGWNLKNNPDDVLRPLDTVPLWDRYIAGGDDPRSDKVEQRKLVLQYVALFKRFGYGPEVVGEAKIIAAAIQRANPEITWARFLQIVGDLRRRKILQGETTLYITPKALHIKLWADWWDTYGHSVAIADLTAEFPEKLLEWFYEMFKYAAESKAALRIVEGLLGEDGVFQRTDYLTDPRGANFFLALTEASPEAALRCLENTIGSISREELLNFTDGRREAIWALERIAVWRELFPGAARLLLKLGEAENETWGNSASGVFAGLFSHGHDKVAPTEAPPEERFPVLVEALTSDSRERRLLGLKACDSALEAQYFVRGSGPEHQGLRREPKLWRPETWGELFDAYRRVWQLLFERLDTLPEDEREETINILLNRAGGVGRYLNLLDMVADTLSALREKPYADRRRIFETVHKVLYYDGKEMLAEARERWQRLQDALSGTDFPSMMQRYVAMDLVEDRVDSEGNSVDRAGPHIEALADEAVRRPELLDQELPWLTTDIAKNGFRFGYSLGTKDTGFVLVTKLLDAQRNASSGASAYFLAGYFRAISETDRMRWETLLDEVAEDEKLKTFVPELTWRSGLADRAALRVLRLAKDGAIGISQFQMFSFGGAVSKLTEDVFQQWIEFLLDSGERVAISIALELSDFYCERGESKHPLPKELTLRLLTAPPLFQRADTRQTSQMEHYHWSELGKRFARKYPDESLVLADRILEHLGEQGTIVEGFFSPTQAVINEITKHRPVGVWHKVTKYIGPPIDTRAYHITHWLRGGDFRPSGDKGVLPLVPLDAIWRWADENVEKRAWYLATFVPKTLFRREGEICLAREVLVRYGARKNVRTNLMANFSSEGWTGPASLHYQEKKKELLDFKKGERNDNVNRWIDEYVASLDREIKWARIQEERESF